MKKKIVSVLLVLCVGACLMACGGSENTTLDNTQEETNETSENTESIDPDVLMDEETYDCGSVDVKNEGDVILDNKNVKITFNKIFGLSEKEDSLYYFEVQYTVENKTDDYYIMMAPGDGGIFGVMFNQAPATEGPNTVAPGKKAVMTLCYDDCTITDADIAAMTREIKSGSEDLEYYQGLDVIYDTTADSSGGVSDYYVEFDIK